MTDPTRAPAPPVNDSSSLVVVPVDFGPGTEAAVAAALSIAQDGAVRLIHVIPDDDPWSVAFQVTSTDAYQRLAALQRDHPNVEVDLRCGVPSEVILQVAERLAADLVVMRAADSTWWTRLLGGSVVDQVQTRAPCQVLIVPREASPAEMALA